jgi:hypothetical protein
MAADVNKDGQVDMLDETYILKIVVGEVKNDERELSDSEISNYLKQYLDTILKYNLTDEQLSVLFKLD